MPSLLYEYHCDNAYHTVYKSSIFHMNVYPHKQCLNERAYILFISESAVL